MLALLEGYRALLAQPESGPEVTYVRLDSISQTIYPIPLHVVESLAEKVKVS